MRIQIADKLNAKVGLGILAAALAASPIATRAGTNGFIVPTIRGTANSESGYWETFTNAVGAPGNLPDQPGATTDAVLTQINPGAFITGGNIYNPSTNSAFTIEDAVPFVLGTVVLQTRTLGLPLNYNSVSLIYSDTNGTHALAPLFRYELSRAAGGVSSLWQWDLMGLNVTNYTIAFDGSAPHVSFDSLMLDTAAPVSTNFVDSAAFAEQPFGVRSRIANLARQSYPFSSATKTTANTFGALGSGNFDSRDAQYLLGWSLAGSIPPGKGANNYLIRRARVTLTLSSGGYVFNGTLRDYRTYLPTNDPRHLTPTTTNYPVELFGVGFRGGFTNGENAYVPWTSTNYPQTGPWSSDPNFDPFAEDANYLTNRVAFAAGFDTNGVLVDVSNNVFDDGTNGIVHAFEAASFEVAPFAVGQTTNVAPGETMAAHQQITFDINLDDPLIYGYLQKGLNEGNLSFMASSFAEGTQGGAPTYPVFYTIFNVFAAPHEFPLLDLEGEIVRTSADGDADGLSDDWENFYFGSLANGATSQSDGDTMNNLAEYNAGTIPTATTNVLQMLAIRHTTNTSEVHFTFAPGRQYNVRWSDDLQNWQTVTNPPLTYLSAWLAKTVANPGYPSPVYAVWRDTNATNQVKFYRAEAHQ